MDVQDEEGVGWVYVAVRLVLVNQIQAQRASIPGMEDYRQLNEAENGYLGGLSGGEMRVCGWR